MIERLMQEDPRYGEPEYSQRSAEIVRATRALCETLDAEEKQHLTRLENAYQLREAAAIRSAFQEGFCVAVQLALDVLEHSRQNEGICH
ncbi:hypothetical protein DWX58_00915 [Pseudoflavonifractor sp. AF19-9AC]|uniref:DUF6809 family protein n=1 Tax=Pseudoflavonifractor sp. AF19-9AC TaxID=2292244 RepID=UPI000E553F6D|nr:DUF6809 family protein [Pseudoflavonifractor sp. AF19-9AC]RHR11055.1 hypothetical protein DWX58_00915 [Pseudoflavonifractor sp. AF19-9AC]